jgi:hypothetical protein
MFLSKGSPPLCLWSVACEPTNSVERAMHCTEEGVARVAREKWYHSSPQGTYPICLLMGSNLSRF